VERTVVSSGHAGQDAEPSQVTTHGVSVEDVMIHAQSVHPIDRQTLKPRRPTQAVILAGGRGLRMRPFTDTSPKPMLEIHGKPFLEYLVQQLRDEGFERVLILLGWRPEVIQEYFGDGSRWGVRIEYLVSDVNDDTGRRLKLAESYLDQHFLLLYCDNYWPLSFDWMWRRFVTAGVRGMITVYRNRDAYTRDGVLVGPDDYILVYDKSRSRPDLQGVEIGYAILDRSVISDLPSGNVSFESVAYPALAEQRELLAFQTDHRYYSIGAPGRIPLTEQHLARLPAILLDRDGVLNRKPPRAQYVCSWDDWVWLPGVLDGLRLLRQLGYRVIVVSNQAGIARGMLTPAKLDEIHQRMCAEAAAAGGQIDAVYYCPHGWDDGCECRKPRPGLLFQAQRDLSLDLTRTLFVGDDQRDRQAADGAGCPFALVSDDTSLLQIARMVERRAAGREADVNAGAGNRA
jgi:D-glycero-D-manno-heptose 1,7-bisphosphate phosphatase